LQSSARGCLSVGPRRGAANEPSLREELRCAPTERLKGGGTAACAPPPRPSRYSAVRVPPQPNVEGSRRQVGYGSGISPRCLAAACGSRDKAPTTTTAICDTSFQRRTQIVSTKTYVHRARLVLQNPGRLFLGRSRVARTFSNIRVFAPAYPPGPSHSCAIALPLLLPAQHRIPSSRPITGFQSQRRGDCQLRPKSCPQ
jgi:hypothetical protein